MALAQRIAELQTAAADALIVKAPLPDFEAMARKADPRDETRKARILAHVFDWSRSHAVRESIAASMVNGACIALWTAKRDGLPIIPAARLPVRAAFKEDVGNVSTPEDAISYWRGRIPLDADQVVLLREALTQMYTAALPVAAEYGATVMDAIAELFAKAIAEGTSLSDFRLAFSEQIPNLARNTVETIYRTTLSRAYGARRTAGIREAGPIASPFLQYITIPDDRRTAVCRAMDGWIASIDDPAWLEMTPPLHYNCRSTLSPIGYLEAIRRGIAAYSPDRRSIVLTKGPRPYGDYPRFTLDHGKLKIVQPAPGFGGFSGLFDIAA